MGRRDMIKRDRIPFVQIENTIIEKKLTAFEIAVYVALCIRSNMKDEAWPSYPTIAKDAGISRMTAVRTVEKLLEKGLIEKIKRGEQSNLYTVKLIGGSTSQILPSVSEILPSTCGILGVVPERDSNNNHLNKNNEQKNSALRRHATLFYEAYEVKMAVKPKWGAQECKLLKSDIARLSGQNGLLEKCIKRFFSDSIPEVYEFVNKKRAGYTYGVFHGCLDMILVTLRKVEVNTVDADLATKAILRELRKNREKKSELRRKEE